MARKKLSTIVTTLALGLAIGLSTGCGDARGKKKFLHGTSLVPQKQAEPVVRDGYVDRVVKGAGTSAGTNILFDGKYHMRSYGTLFDDIQEGDFVRVYGRDGGFCDEPGVFDECSLPFGPGDQDLPPCDKEKYHDITSVWRFSVTRDQQFVVEKEKDLTSGDFEVYR